MMLELNPQLQERLGLSEEEIAQFCQQWQITEMALFGSILKEKYPSTSDIDIMICLEPEARHGLLALAAIKHELEDRTGRQIDIAIKESVENSENWIRRQDILNTAQLIYEQGFCSKEPVAGDSGLFHSESESSVEKYKSNRGPFHRTLQRF